MTKTDSNIMKGIAIIMMYLHHLFYQKTSFENYDIQFGFLGMERTISIAIFCKVCVALFVFVTAYGITKQFELRNIESANAIANYSLQRYIKLMIGYWTIFCLALLASCALKKHTFADVYGGAEHPIKSFVIDLFGMAYAYGTETFNATWWYMAVAIVLIFVIPIIIMIYNKIGILIIPLTLLLPVLCNGEPMIIVSKLNWYALGIVLAIVCARYNVFERWRACRKILFRTMVTICLVLGLLCLYYVRTRGLCSVYLVDNLTAVDIAFLITGVLGYIPVLNRVLEFIGIHSMNLFMMHTFIKSYFFKDFTYSWRYSWLILVILIADTLIISIVIEILKKTCKISFLEQKLCNKIDLLFNNQ